MICPVKFVPGYTLPIALHGREGFERVWKNSFLVALDDLNFTKPSSQERHKLRLLMISIALQTLAPTQQREHVDREIACKKTVVSYLMKEV